MILQQIGIFLLILGALVQLDDPISAGAVLALVGWLGWQECRERRSIHRSTGKLI